MSSPTGSRILSLWLPDLATERLRRRDARSAAGGSGLGGSGPDGAARPEERPLATFSEAKGALRLAAVDPLAAAAGLGPGLMVTNARALVPELELRPAEPAAEMALLEEIRHFAERWTPYAAIDRSFVDDPDGGRGTPAAGRGQAHPGLSISGGNGEPPGGALWLDITGCAHLFGGEAGLRRDLLDELQKRGFKGQAAIADHPGTAWALARYGDGRRVIVRPGDAKGALGPLPVGALRLPPEVVQILERLGLTHIESLWPLPRQALAARFGDLLTRRLDQALGRIDEPISPEAPRLAHRADVVLAEPIAHAEGLQAITRRLLKELCAGLETASAGVRRLELACVRVDDTVVSVGVGTSRPNRNPRQLYRLFEERLERIDPGFGIERAVLEARLVEPLVPEPIAWRTLGAGDLDQVRDFASAGAVDAGSHAETRARAGAGAPDVAAAAAAAAADVAPLIDRLGNRLGEAEVVQLVPRPSHLPERAQQAVPAFSPAARPTWGGGTREAGAAAVALAPQVSASPSRPLRLLRIPEPIEAMASLPDEPPVLFRWRRVLHRVRNAKGPERLAPEWWRGQGLDREGDGADQEAATRDYFAVENTDGQRFWLFREGLYRAGTAVMPRWYLHGLFA